MDYEQEYKEIVGKLKMAYLYAQTGSTETKAVLEDILPELKESKDERIRKTLIDYFEHHTVAIKIFYGIRVDDILAWLEKQGEKKPFWSEKFIADVFEKVGLAKIVREQGNNELTNAVQMAMIELEKQC